MPSCSLCRYIYMGDSPVLLPLVYVWGLCVDFSPKRYQLWNSGTTNKLKLTIFYSIKAIQNNSVY